MESIFNYKKAVISAIEKKDSLVKTEVSSQWLQLEIQYPEIKKYVDNGQISISRGQIFNICDDKERFIAAMLWGFPAGIRGLKTIMRNREIIISHINSPAQSFEEKYRNIKKMERVGISIITKLMYFWKVKYKNYMIPIIDSHVINIMEYFSELSDNIPKSKGVRFIEYTSRKFDEIAKAMSQQDQDGESISFDDIEYFLFETDKNWCKIMPSKKAEYIASIKLQ